MLATVVSCGLPCFALAIEPGDTPSGEAIQRRQAQQLRQQAEQDAARPDLLQPSAVAASVDPADLPAETPCFEVRRIVVDDTVFGWLPRLLQPVVGRCIGAAALRTIRQAANGALIERGFVTSHVVVPPQNLASGTLKLDVMPGRIGGIRFDPDAGLPIGTAATVLPAALGALLNQRDLDQALENLRCLGGQPGASFDIVPGAAPGVSDVVIRPDRGRRWHATLGADNGGVDGIGRYQWSGSLTVDSPLFLHDRLQVAAGANANPGARGRAAQSFSAAWDVPLGYAALFTGASRSRYLLTVPGWFEPIRYSGDTSQVEAGASYVPYRNAHACTELRARLFRKVQHNFVDDTEIDVQHRDVTGYELSASLRRYVGDAALGINTGWRANLPGLTRAAGTVIGMPAFDGKTRIAIAGAALDLPFAIARQRFAWHFAVNAQRAWSPLTPSDYFTIGDRYTVRGFDGRLTLASESGWAASNEFDWLIGPNALFVGVDAGGVAGPTTQYLPGRMLAGAVVGARGRFAGPRATVLAYEFSAGRPLFAPSGFPRGQTAWFMQLTYLL